MKNQNFDPLTHYRDPEIASSYDEYRFSSTLGKWGHEREVRAFIRALDRTYGVTTALDAPCGTGRMTRVLINKGIRVTGVDISRHMINEAKKKIVFEGKIIDFAEGDITDLQFKDDSFDLVTCIRLFGHVPVNVRIRMLSEMRRVTRKWVIVNYFYVTSLTKLKRRIKRSMFHKYEGVKYSVTKSQMRREFSESRLREECITFSRRYYSEEVYTLLSKI